MRSTKRAERTARAFTMATVCALCLVPPSSAEPAQNEAEQPQRALGQKGAFFAPPPPKALGEAAPSDQVETSAAPRPDANQTYDLPQFALAGPKGFGFATQDGSFTLILHWLLQSDFRDFLTNVPTPDRDTFIVRFAGFRLDAILYRKVRAQMFVNFAESRVTLLDTFIEAELASWFRIRVGKF